MDKGMGFMNEREWTTHILGTSWQMDNCILSRANKNMKKCSSMTAVRCSRKGPNLGQRRTGLGAGWVRLPDLYNIYHTTYELDILNTLKSCLFHFSIHPSQLLVSPNRGWADGWAVEQLDHVSTHACFPLYWSWLPIPPPLPGQSAGIINSTVNHGHVFDRRLDFITK